jgi:hypothetical protein
VPALIRSGPENVLKLSDGLLICHVVEPSFVMPITPPLVPLEILPMRLTPALLPPRTSVVAPPTVDWPVTPPEIEISRVASEESLEIV